MMTPLVLAVMALCGVALTIVSGLPNLLLLAVLCLIASLVLLVYAWWTRPSANADRWPTTETRPVAKRGQEARRPAVIVDGSNVMYWDGGTPKIEPLLAVIARIEANGCKPGIVFDANAGYLLAGRYRDDRPFARALGLPEDSVLVVPKGTQADAYILQAARDLDARILTNDRYRDWEDRHPEVSEPGRLIRGGYRDGALWLDLDAAPQRAVALDRKAR